MISRRLSLAIMVAGVWGAASARAPAQSTAIQPGPPIIKRFAGRPPPPIAAIYASGEPVDFASLRGKVVIVNLWATWCGPCRLEMPSLERLAALHPKDLAVVAVSNDEKGWPAVRQFWGPQLAHLRPALAAGPGLAEQLGVLGLPYTLVIDRRGLEVARVPKAAQWDTGDPRQLIEQAIATE